MAWDHCIEIIDGEECGRESCADIHMTKYGHNFKETPPTDAEIAEEAGITKEDFPQLHNLYAEEN